MSLSGQSVQWMNPGHPSGNPTQPDTNDRALEVLGLTHNPFSMAPDIVNFFSSPKVETTVVEVLQMVETRMGFALLYGDVGLGKTTISRRILFELERRGIQTSLVFNTFFQGADLISQINKDFDNSIDTDSLKKQMEALNNFLLNERAKGNNCVIIIDDAQSLSIESLELVRQISNMETGIDKIVQIVLIGQPELEEKLNRYELRQLKSRIVLKRGFKPYSMKESGAYITSKLSRASDDDRLMITDAAVRLIHKASRGFPRRINVIMGRSLYAAVALKTQRINYDVVELALKDMDESEIFVPVTSRLGVRLFVAAVFILAIGLPLASQYLDTSGFSANFAVIEEDQKQSHSSIEGDKVEVIVHDDTVVSESAKKITAPIQTDNNPVEDTDISVAEIEVDITNTPIQTQTLEKIRVTSIETPIGQDNAIPVGGNDSASIAAAQKEDTLVLVERTVSRTEIVTDDALHDIISIEPSEDIAIESIKINKTEPSSNIVNDSISVSDLHAEPIQTVDQSIVAFLQAYQLEQFAESFSASMKKQDLRHISDDILAQSGLRLVTLPSELDEVRLRYATLEYTSESEKAGEFFLFWQPNLWPEESFSFFYRRKEVIELQRRLKALGIYRHAIDGIAGVQTNTSVEKFQQTVGLPVTAQPDIETLFLLEFLSQEEILDTESAGYSVTAE